ncbi:MAG: 50S ribosomal protein L1, partial [Candidatus Thermoplasmatota archaeon]|nr:50S ribosomal protein L1 [Candidatus Thermoplasmatota archaeon]
MVSDVKQAIADVLETRKERKFTETVDVAINLRDVDLQNPQKRINDELALPHGRGRPARVAIF